MLLIYTPLQEKSVSTVYEIIDCPTLVFFTFCNYVYFIIKSQVHVYFIIRYVTGATGYLM